MWALLPVRPLKITESPLLMWKNRYLNGFHLKWFLRSGTLVLINLVVNNEMPNNHNNFPCQYYCRFYFTGDFLFCLIEIKEYTFFFLCCSMGHLY